MLIARGNRYIGLTPDGERVLKWGRQILFDYDSLQKDITGSKKVCPARCGSASFPPPIVITVLFRAVPIPIEK